MRRMGPVGVIGIGNMGLALAQNLLDKNFPVHVRDVIAAREQTARQAGAQVHASPAALAAACEIVIVCVVDALQTEAVLFGDDGVIAAARKPAAVMLCPTIAPADTERFAARLAGHGIACLDAPMSGGPIRAREGSMSLMVACDDETFMRYERLLNTMSCRLFRIGTRIGDGARTKLVNNLLATINLAGAAECLALAQRLGLDANTTQRVIDQSSGQSWIGSDRMHRALRSDATPLAHMSLLAKDSALALQAAAATHASPPALGSVAAQMFAQACKDGLFDEDDSALLRWLSVQEKP
jgi:3-hydroxyisobutyrate dehydrogenase